MYLTQLNFQLQDELCFYNLHRLGQMFMSHINFIFLITCKNNHVYLARVYDTDTCYARLSRFLYM